MTDRGQIQRAYTTILEHFVATGRAPHYVELAESLGVTPDEARELQRDTAAAAPIQSAWLSHDTDYIESWAPFSNVPTHVTIKYEGLLKWYGQ